MADRVQQVDGPEHVFQAFAEFEFVEGREPDAVSFDLTFGPGQPRAQRCVGDEHGVGDVFSGDAADESKRQRETGFCREVGRAGDEQQAEAIVTTGRIVEAGWSLVDQQRQPLAKPGIPSHGVDGDAFGDRCHPGGGVDQQLAFA